jgi:hypothetical protein
LADYQNDSYIESGWLRILEFCPSAVDGNVVFSVDTII